MSAFYTDGDFTKKWPIGKARKSYPIPGDVATYLLEQDFIQARSSYSETTLNTTHYTAIGGASPTDGGSTGDSSAYLVSISPHQDLGQGMVKWTETFSVKPADRSEYESFTYNFIGYYGVFGVNTTTVTGRERFTKTVMSRLAYTYYRIFSSGGDYTSADSIPIVEAQKYIYGATTNFVDYLADSPPFIAATSPSRTAYEAVAAGGAGIGTGANAGEIVAEQSIVRRWQGNIYERVTRYIKAQ